jgi:hypothetical protein
MVIFRMTILKCTDLKLFVFNIFNLPVTKTFPLTVRASWGLSVLIPTRPLKNATGSKACFFCHCATVTSGSVAAAAGVAPPAGCCCTTGTWDCEYRPISDSVSEHYSS